MTFVSRAHGRLIQFLVLCLPAAPLAGQEHGTGREYMRWFEEKYEVGQGGSYTPEEMLPVIEAREKKNYRTVLRLASELIGREAARFYSAPYANWVKSLAYIERSTAREELNGDADQTLEDAMAAAQLGNLKAAKAIVRQMFGYYKNDPKSAVAKARHGPSKSFCASPLR